MEFKVIFAAVMLLVACSAGPAYCQGVKNTDKPHSGGKVVTDRGDDISTKVLDSVKYYMPEFRSGAIAFNNGDISKGVINISAITQKVVFIDTEGKVLELVNNDDVKMISAHRTVFLKFRGRYVQVIKRTPSLDLGVVKKVSFTEPETKGAYGTSAVTSSVQAYSSYSMDGMTYKLDDNIVTPFIYNEYLMLHRDGKFFTPSLKTFGKLYPEKKEAIEAFVKEKKLHFDSSDDVSVLMDFLNQQ